MFLERRATREVLKALEWSPVVLVEGPRQAGKSVLVRELVGATRPANYVTLDDAVVLSAARARGIPPDQAQCRSRPPPGAIHADRIGERASASQAVRFAVRAHADRDAVAALAR